MNKVEFLETFDQCIDTLDVNFIAVAVEGVGVVEELIINPRQNFETKRAYYDKTYDDNMRLVFNNDIGITYITGVNNLGELHWNEGTIQ